MVSVLRGLAQRPLPTKRSQIMADTGYVLFGDDDDLEDDDQYLDVASDVTGGCTLPCRS